MTRPDDWPFAEAPNVAAITTVQVMTRSQPILLVQRFADDHSWAFLCGTSDDLDRDGRIIGMGEALVIDPSLRELADLEPGWVAWREQREAKWHRAPYDET